MHVCRPLGEAEQCVYAQMKFSYTFSQRHNTDLLYSRGHHLAPGGNMRRGPADLLALSGERLPRRVRYSKSETDSRTAGKIGKLLPVKTFFPFSGQLSHKCCQVSEWSSLSRKKKERKGCYILYLFYKHTQYPLDKYCNSHS